MVYVAIYGDRQVSFVHPSVEHLKKHFTHFRPDPFVIVEAENKQTLNGAIKAALKNYPPKKDA